MHAPLALGPRQSSRFPEQATADPDPACIEEDMQVRDQVAEFSTRVDDAQEADRGAVSLRQHEVRRRPADEGEPGTPPIPRVPLERAIKEFVVENAAVGAPPARSMNRRDLIGVVWSGPPSTTRK